MDLNYYLEINGYSVYSLSKKADIPYSTLNDLVKGITKIENLSFKYAMKLSNALRITPTMLLNCDQKESIERIPFRLFRSNLFHYAKGKEPRDCIEQIIKNRLIDKYYKMGYLEECYFLLAYIDTLCDQSGLPLVTNRYQSYRKGKLDEVFFPDSDSIKYSSIEEAEKDLNVEVLPRFKNFNIIESEINNAI